MTEIERKALELVNEVWLENGMNNTPFTRLPTAVNNLVLIRTIEQHEAFRQQVSDAVEEYFDCEQNGSRSMLEVAETRLRRFIIAKPDPLVEVLDSITQWTISDQSENAKQIRAALAKRGLEIREKK